MAYFFYAEIHFAARFRFNEIFDLWLWDVLHHR